MITNDVYAQYKTKDKQETILFQGQLDKQSAIELWQKIINKASRGAKDISIDMFGAGPVLAEGVHTMQDHWNEFAHALKAQVVFRNFNERAEQTFQMYGTLFSNRKAIFCKNDEPKENINHKLPIGLLRCPSCCVQLRIWENGWNACPSCHHQFQTSIT